LRFIAASTTPDVALIVLHLSYIMHQPSQHLPTFFGFGDLDFLFGTGISATDGHLPFWPYFHCACAETAIFELPVKIVTSPLDSATRFSDTYEPDL